MNTDDLIRTLSADTVVPASPVARLLWVLPAMGVALAGLWATEGLRADLATALQNPISALRIVLTVALGALALWAVVRLARPGARVRLWPLGGIAVAAAGLWVWAYAGVPDGGHQMAIQGKTLWGCLTTIPMLAVLPTAAVLAAVRQGAPTRPMLAGAIAGLAGGGLAAAIYALHCTEDSPLFYVTWYGTAIAGVAVVSSLIAPRLLRW